MTRVVWAAVAAIAIVIAGLVAIAVTTLPSAPGSTVAATTAAPTHTSTVPAVMAEVDVGRYPGVPLTEAQRRRDAAIRVYEAWLTAVDVRACMTAAGYDYRVAVPLPAQSVIDAAVWLGVAPAANAGADPSQHNSDLLHTFTSADVTRFYATLYGEGGCDESARRGHTFATASAVLAEPIAQWRDARAAAANPGAVDAAFLDEHRDVLVAWESTFGSLVTLAGRDADFMAFLAAERARLE